jgi:beta-glucanase (GH16 family)
MMLSFCLPVLCVEACGADDPANAKGNEQLPPAGYRLAWSDEFDGSVVDTNKWNFRTGPRIWSMQKPENVKVENGLMKIILKKEKAGTMEYTAGGLISKKAFKYGYYEARFRVPPTKGWHTSFWMMWNGGRNDDEPMQEVDVCENDSIDTGSYTVNLHRWKPKPHKGFYTKRVRTPDLSADFHVWGCEFTAEKLTFYFDGKPVHVMEATVIPHGEQHIWLTSVAANLGKTDKVDESRLPLTADYDWVRFYEKAQ